MKLSKRQKRDRLNYFGFMLVAFLLVILAFLAAYGCESKPDQQRELGYTITEDSDSLEITNPEYLEEYFKTWEQ